jgi:hypothetical protein
MESLYGLNIDAFLMGLASEAPTAEQFGLSERQAVRVRADRYADRIRAKRERKSA